MITIRSERLQDLEAIRRLHEAAFPSPAEGQLVDLLRASGHLSLSLVADAGGVIGHVAFSPVQIAEHPEITGLGLGPLAVRPDCQRRGVGRSLVRDGLAAARSQAAMFVVVLGSPAYYSEFGFQAARQWKLANEYGTDHEFMALELVPGALHRVQGLVRYSPEFAQLFPPAR